MSSPIVYRVLAGVDRDTFAEVARDLGLTAHGALKRDDDCYEVPWTDAGQTTAVNYVEDPHSDQHYISVRGRDADALLDALDHKIELYDPEELIEIAYAAEERDPDELAENLLRLAITFTEYDRTVHGIFESYALDAPDPQLRKAALDAIGLHAWEELRPVVQKVANEDKAPEVSAYAKGVLERWVAARD